MSTNAKVTPQNLFLHDVACAATHVLILHIRAGAKGAIKSWLGKGLEIKGSRPAETETSQHLTVRKDRGLHNATDLASDVVSLR